MNQKQIESALESLGHVLPEVTPPAASYVPARLAGGLLFVSGQLPIADGALLAKGVVPSEVTPEEAEACAERCAINAIAAGLSAVPAGSEIAGVVRVGVWVASDAGFKAQPEVANGASELLQRVFGDAGRHARAAVSSNALPRGTPVEVEVLFEVVLAG
ncbi:MAG: RidA family protein [Planctomycetota bacterium]